MSSLLGMLGMGKKQTQQPQQSQQPQYGTVVKLNEVERKALTADYSTKIDTSIADFKIQKYGMLEADRYWMAEHWVGDTSPDWMPKPMENWVFATVEQHSANLGSANIVPIVVGQDPGDDDTAVMFDKVIQFLLQPNMLNGRRIIRRAIHTSQKFGTALVMVYFDPSKNGGRMLPEPKELTNPLNGNQFTVSHTLYKGDVCLELIDPSYVIPDSGGYTLDGPGACGWITIRTPRKRNWILGNPMFQKYVGKSQLKELLDRIPNNQDKTSVEFYYGRTVNQSRTGADEVLLDAIWVREMDESGNWHINLIYKIADELLYYAKDMYKDGEYPFAILYDYEVDKSFFGMGESKQVIPSQNTINQIQRLAALNAMHMTNTQKIVTLDSGIDAEEVAKSGSVPGAVFKSRTPDGVVNLKVNEIPGTVFKVMEDAREGIRTIMAMDEANMGQFGGSVTAASGIKMIQDRANVRDHDKGMNVEDFVARMVYLMTSRIQQFYTEERYIPIIGEKNTSQQFFPFRGTDYQDIRLTVQVEAGSGAPQSKASIEQKAWDMFTKQSEKNFDPPLITVEELLGTIEAFPIKDRIIQRVKEANAGKLVQQAMQLADVILMLRQQGVDPSQFDPATMMALVEQAKNVAPPTQGGGATPVPGPQAPPLPPQG